MGTTGWGAYLIFVARTRKLAENMNTRTYQWNAGWFGAQLGGSLWMIGTLFVGAPVLSLPALSGPIICALVNLAGAIFWWNRRKLDCHASLQIFMVLLCLASFSLLAILDASGYLLQWEPRLKQPGHAYLFLAVFPALSALFYLQNRPARSGKTAGQADR